MKALILAAGKGTRLRPLTHTTPKHLLPVANKPILFYVIEQIKAAGIDDIGIVISPETGDEIKKALAEGIRWGVKISYIVQSPPLGLAHAVKVARNFLGESTFLLFLGDNLIHEQIKHVVAEFNEHPLDALIVLKSVVDPRAFGVAEVDEGKKILRVVEKPKEPRSNLALVGLYIFTPEVHQAIDLLKPSWRGEYEITDAIQMLLTQGKNIRSHVLEGWWLDTGKKEDLLEANHILLDEQLEYQIQGEIDSSSKVSGRVRVEAGSKIEKSLIRGPVSIGANCRISNSLIGPYTSISMGTIIENSSIEYSVILEGCRIENVQHLSDSVVGRQAQVFQKKAFEGTRLFIGDDAKIEL